ncbi:putative peptidoglycan bound protein [Listeria monocytogenes]|nr:putative peptidoglycan bound protein [Listeria monocytogenes]
MASASSVFVALSFFVSTTVPVFAVLVLLTFAASVVKITIVERTGTAASNW